MPIAFAALALPIHASDGIQLGEQNPGVFQQPPVSSGLEVAGRLCLHNQPVSVVGWVGRMVRAAGSFSPIRGANFIFQTRAGVARAGREHLRHRGRGLTLRLSAIESDTTEGDHGGEVSGFSSTGSDSVEEEGGDGVIVGAEGVFPVELSFLNRGGGNGSFVEEDDWVEGRVEAPREVASAGKWEHVLEWEGSIGRVDRGGRPERVNSSDRLWRGRRGPEGKVDGDETMNLGPWMADFGLVVSAGGIDGGVIGSGLDGGGDSLVGWGWVSQQEGFVGERRYCKDAPDCGQSVVGANYTETKEGSRVELRNVSGRRTATEAPREQCKRVGDISNAGLSWSPIEETTTIHKGIKATGNTMPSPSTMESTAIETAMKRGHGDHGGFDSGGSPRASVCGNNEAPDPVGFLDGLRRLARGRRDREARKLELAVRAAGDELYGLSDRLSALSSSVASEQCTAPGRSGVSVAAAVKEVESLREALKTVGGRQGRKLKRTADIRRAVRDAGKGVREAERAVEKDAKLLAEAREHSEK